MKVTKNELLEKMRFLLSLWNNEDIMKLYNQEFGKGTVIKDAPVNYEQFEIDDS